MRQRHVGNPKKNKPSKQGQQHKWTKPGQHKEYRPTLYDYFENLLLNDTFILVLIVVAVTGTALILAYDHQSVINKAKNEASIIERDGAVAVVRSADGGMNFMVSSTSVIGAMFVGEEFRDQAAFTGFAVMQSALFTFSTPAAAKRSRFLLLGLGSGIVPTWIRAHGVPVDVVEYSVEVVRMAEKHFYYKSCGIAKEESDTADVQTCQSRVGKTFVTDGREFLFRTEAEKYSVVISDVWSGSNPGHLSSKQVFSQIKTSRLTVGGLLVVNFVGLHTGPHAKMPIVLGRTIRSVFKHVRCYRDSDPSRDQDFATNLVFFASDEPITFSIPPNVDGPEESSFWVMKHFQKWSVFDDVLAEDASSESAGPEGDSDGVLTDDYNPLLLADAQSAVEEKMEEHSRKLLGGAVFHTLRDRNNSG